MNFVSCLVRALVVIVQMFLLTASLQADLITGLQAYYTFDADATDQFGSYDGTVVGATQTGSGKIGGAYQFTGSQHIDVGGPLPVGNNARAYSMWVNPTGSGNTIGLYQGGGPGSSGRDFTVWLERRGGTTNNSIYLRRNVNDVKTFSNLTINNSWHHVVVSYDGTSSHNMKFYIDGANIPIETGFSPNSTFNTSLITQSIGGAYQPSDSIIDEVGIWNRSLTALEVSTLYNGGAGIQLAGATAAVPEPSSLMFCAMLSSVYCILRRRRTAGDQSL